MKILLLQLKRIGDLILTTPAIRCLREEFPQARLALIADSSSAGLLDSIAVDEHWVYKKGGGLRGLAGWGPNAWLRQRLFAFGADWALDFTGTDRSAYLSTFSFSKRRVTFQRFRKKPLRKYLYTDFVNSSVSGRHTADHYTDLLEPLGVRRENVSLDLRLRAEDFDRARALLASAGAGDSYVVVHAGAARREKYWLPERWADVIGFLHAEFGLMSILTGSQDPNEREHLSRIKSALRCNYIDVSGKTDLLGLGGGHQGRKIALRRRHGSDSLGRRDEDTFVGPFWADQPVPLVPASCQISNIASKSPAALYPATEGRAHGRYFGRLGHRGRERASRLKVEPQASLIPVTTDVRL